MKTSLRRDAILEIIENNGVGTQEELSALLRARGFEVTQATVSRDINQLHLVKKSVGGSYRYAVSTGYDAGDGAKYQNILKETVTSIKLAGSLVVIKTYTGMANAAAAAIDSVAGKLTVGTIAGDDTIFVATQSESDAKIFISAIKDFAEI